MTRRPTTSPSEIQELLNKGFTRAEIATIKGITKSGVSWHLRQAGVKTLTETLKEALPWEIAGPQVQTNPYRQILLHLEFKATGGKGMSEEKRTKLRSLYERLDEFSMVVRYDPAIPPHPGQKYGGFEFVPRKESDGDLIIRVDKYTKIPVEDRERWSLPAREDWPE